MIVLVARLALVDPLFSRHQGAAMTVDVLLEAQPDGQVRATLLGWPELAAAGSTDAEALARLRQLIANRLASAQIVSLTVDEDEATHPWAQLAARFRDNPLLDEVAATIGAGRSQHHGRPVE